MPTIWSWCRQYVWIFFSGEVLSAPGAIGTRGPNVEGQPCFVHNYVRTVYLDLEGPSRVREASGQLSVCGREMGITKVTHSLA